MPAMKKFFTAAADGAQDAARKVSHSVNKVESALLGTIPGLRVYKHYEILGAQVASAGPALAFRVYDARPLATKGDRGAVSVWLLDKRALAGPMPTRRAQVERRRSCERRAADGKAPPSRRDPPRAAAGRVQGRHRPRHGARDGQRSQPARAL